jgi:RNA polymerase sigma-54 factor
MALEAKLLQKMGQSLLMTPQLQQAIKLLQLGRQEYLDAIHQEILENPLLEEIPFTDEGGGQQDAPSMETLPTPQPNEDSEPQRSTTETQADWEDFSDFFTDYSGAAQPKGSLTAEDHRPLYELIATHSESLFDHLIEQLRFIDITERERTLILHLIGNLSRDGLLVHDLDEIAAEADTSRAELEDAREILKTLDPAGVGASSIGECLLFQLERIGKLGLESTIVKKHLDKLERHQLDRIAREEGVSIDDVQRAIVTIQSLEPHPGRQFSDESQRYIVPDVYVHRVERDYVIELNEEGVPRVRLNEFCLRLLREPNSTRDDNRQYLQERYKSASWLLKSIQQRQRTIYKVAESIVRFQRKFLDDGIQHLKPMVLKDVADDIGMHESTVSRVTSNKYVHTPQGVFELKFFFTSGIKGGDGDVSSSAVRERIKALITQEKPGQAFSDQQLVEILEKEGITIARRTVAKYRESLGVESSSRRNKLASFSAKRN